jgi:PAS domain S-box-containing protein
MAGGSSMDLLPLSGLHIDDRTFRALLETIPDAALLVDSTGVLAAANEVAEQIFGWSESEIVGRPIEDLMPRRYHADHPHMVRDYFSRPQVILGSGRFRHGDEIELRAARKDGEEFPVEISVGPLETADGTFALAILRDVTESRRLRARLREYSSGLEDQVRARVSEIQQKQAELLQSAKVAALGALTAGVVHQLNTPLGALSSANQTALSLARKLAGRAEADSQRWAALLDDVAQASEQAMEQINHTIASLRIFSRIDFEEESEANVVDGLRSALALLEPRTAGRIRVETDFADLPKIRARHADLNQAFMNVLLNAVEAIPGEGAIRVAAFARDGSAVVAIADTGVGIPDSALGKVTDPGYTTKGVRVGAGLGLAITQRVMEEHGGALAIESRENEGATVTLSLPLER